MTLAVIALFSFSSPGKLRHGRACPGHPRLRSTISQKSINKYLAALGSFPRWLLLNEYIDNDVMTGMYLEIDKRKRKRFPFSADQLKAIFDSRLFSFSNESACHGANLIRKSRNGEASQR